MTVYETRTVTEKNHTAGFWTDKARAEADVTERNARATQMGITSRYEVGEKDAGSIDPKNIRS